ncbi:MAG: DUF4340 domain-containing protein [Clostridia bacterium]|nr:DUF4340 domain-containing protein [Clostridia bacterium]
MKKGVKLALAAAVLLALALAWILVNRQTEDPLPAEETAAPTVLVGEKTASLSSLRYTVKGGEECAFLSRGGTWYAASDEKMPLEQTSVSEIAATLGSVTATRFVVADGAASAEYGLDAPSAAVTLGYEDGSSLSYFLGAKNVHTGEYYFNREGEKAVYTVSSALIGACESAPEDLIREDKIETIPQDKVTAVTSETPLGTITLTPSTRTVSSTDEDGKDTEETVTVYLLKNEAGAEEELDEETGSAILAGLLAPTIVSRADYYLEEEELAAYGLDAPVRITVSYTEERTVTAEGSSGGTLTEARSYTLSFGRVADGEETKTYLRLPGSDMAFLVDVSAFSLLF